MKYLIVLSFCALTIVACKEGKNKTEDKTEMKAKIDSKRIEDSINKVREQEVLNLDIDDSKTFDKIIESSSQSEKVKEQ